MGVYQASIWKLTRIRSAIYPGKSPLMCSRIDKADLEPKREASPYNLSIPRIEFENWPFFCENATLRRRMVFVALKSQHFIQVISVLLPNNREKNRWKTGDPRKKRTVIKWSVNCFLRASKRLTSLFKVSAKQKWKEKVKNANGDVFFG